MQTTSRHPQARINPERAPDLPHRLNQAVQLGVELLALASLAVALATSLLALATFVGP